MARLFWHYGCSNLSQGKKYLYYKVMFLFLIVVLLLVIAFAIPKAKKILLNIVAVIIIGAVLFAAFAIVLDRRGGQEDEVVGQGDSNPCSRLGIRKAISADNHNAILSCLEKNPQTERFDFSSGRCDWNMLHWAVRSEAYSYIVSQ